MKKIFVLLGTALMLSCAGYNSIDNFYETHKNDSQVTAVRVPQFMFSLISNISPEMKNMIGNTKDLRYMQFPSATTSQTQFLNTQMNYFTQNSFIEVFRKNDNLKRNVVAVREKRDVVKEIMIYNNNTVNGSFLYFNGNFNPEKVRVLAKNNAFEKLSSDFLSQMSATTPGITN